MRSTELTCLWNNSNNVFEMLKAFYETDEAAFRAQVPQIHKYLLACCWKIKHMLPQKDIRRGLEIATQYIEGNATKQELSNIDWYVEAEAFAIEQAETDEELTEIRHMISQIDGLCSLSFEKARETLQGAAYFADNCIMYQHRYHGHCDDMKLLVFNEELFRSQFMCADLLREHIKIEALGI